VVVGRRYPSTAHDLTPVSSSHAQERQIVAQRELRPRDRGGVAPDTDNGIEVYLMLEPAISDRMSALGAEAGVTLSELGHHYPDLGSISHRSRVARNSHKTKGDLDCERG
jgi:hypothetical protein